MNKDSIKTVFTGLTSAKISKSIEAKISLIEAKEIVANSSSEKIEELKNLSDIIDDAYVKAHRIICGIVTDETQKDPERLMTKYDYTHFTTHIKNEVSTIEKVENHVDYLVNAIKSKDGLYKSNFQVFKFTEAQEKTRNDIILRNMYKNILMLFFTQCKIKCSNETQKNTFDNLSKKFITKLCSEPQQNIIDAFIKTYANKYDIQICIPHMQEFVEQYEKTDFNPKTKLTFTMAKGKKGTKHENMA